MLYFVIIVSIIVIAFFVWAGIDNKKQKKKEDMDNEEKPLFHTEEDLEEYGKPMDSQSVNLDDAE